MDSREIALRALVEFYKTVKKPAVILNHIIPADLPAKDRDLAWEMTMGAIKYRKKLEFMAQSYIKAPLKQQEIEIRAALILGFYQLIEMKSIPDFAAVNETVSAVKNRISEKSSGFINAILRAYLMQPTKTRFPDRESDPAKYLSLFYSYPEWLVRRWLERIGLDETESLLMAGNRRPETNFKILNSKITDNEVQRILVDDDIDFVPGNYLPGYFRSDDAAKVLKHELFNDGYMIVQDESQGVPLYLLDPPPGSTVLDLCAAPGGKSIGLADRVGESGRIISVDFNNRRLQELNENMKRTGFTIIEIIESDMLDFKPESRFEYILLDVPCSSLGTIGNNADLRWTKSEKDIMIMSDTQKELLQKTADFAKSGATVVYATCTTEPEEIEEVVYGFLEKNSEFYLEDGNSTLVEPFKTGTGVYRTWPHKHGICGGGFARLRKSGQI